jgi:MFS family permease
VTAPAGPGGPVGPAVLDATDVARLQRRTVAVLVVSQTFGGVGTTVALAVAAVLADELSGSESLAGLVQTAQVAGAALAAYVLARVMGSHGRRVGLAGGFLVGGAGAAVCVVGGVLGSYAVLLLGALLLGATSAAGYQSRYAAADLAAPRHRARALSIVLWATTVGAVLGPNLVGASGRLASALGLPPLTGPFLVSVVVVLVAALVLVLFLRPDPLLTARRLAGVPVEGRRGRTSWSRVRHLLRTHPGVGAGMLAMSASHTVMVAVMVMTPLHMHHGGATLEVIGLVISVHVLGMYFLSPLVGLVADRWGRPPVLVAGAVVFWVALAISGSSPAGASPGIGVGLFLLGLGWSCCTVAGSVLVVDSTPLTDRTDVQGAADLLMNVAAAAGGALAGVVMDLWGFSALAGFAAVLVFGVLAAVTVARREPLLGAR